MSKLITIPKFKDLPPYTDAANVKENIDNWLSRNKTSSIEAYLRPEEKGHRGYRFVTCSDFEETITEFQTIQKVKFLVIFQNDVRTPDHFCPLYFKQWGVNIILMYDNYLINFKSDAVLKRITKAIKSGDLPEGDKLYVHDYQEGKYIYGERTEHQISKYIGR